MTHRHTRRLLRTGLIATALLSHGASYAQQESAGGGQPPEGWGLGVVASASQKPYRDVDGKAEVWPMLTYENRWIRLFGPGLDVKLGKTGPVSYALTAGMSREGYRASDSSYLDGMDERKGGIWLGGRVMWEAGFAKLSAAWQADASSHSDGQKVTLGVERRFAVDNLGFTPRVKAIWLDRKYVDYYYGVSASEARSNRPQYAGSSTVNSELGLRVDYRLTPAQTVFLDAGVTMLGSAIKDSPLVGRSTVGEARLGYLYRF
ncbi:MipA/OmpV family protein [Viridibacterium curvum]|uniref:MipA/OmpV family protein n=1 Tax=Viridibacterium curvum TaxID=1101404 RepID=A0ABP9QK16_9RHOO